MTDLLTYTKYTRGCTHTNGEGETSARGCRYATVNKLDTYNWLADIKSPQNKTDIVEIRFKNTRKDFFINDTGEELKTGDLVAVEASPGHDIGIVSLAGEIVYKQLNKFNIPQDANFKKVYRFAKQLDVEKWERAIEREEDLLLRSKEIVDELNINMKIGDIELQGDGTKAIFYYTADQRVDFRELIKIFAEQFRVRIEMKQIGARQESGRIGGLGTCGRELCCIGWKTNFSSVTTNAARLQELSLNPTRLAGQCGKLKCCLNYEVEVYQKARKKLPDSRIRLKTKEGNAHFQKSDVLREIMWYIVNPDKSFTMIPVSLERVNKIIEMNKNGKIPDTLLQDKRDVSEIIRKKHNINVEDETPFSSNKDMEIPKNNRNNNNSNRRRRKNRPKNKSQNRNYNQQKNNNKKTNNKDRENSNNENKNKNSSQNKGNRNKNNSNYKKRPSRNNSQKNNQNKNSQRKNTNPNSQKNEKQG